MIERILIALLLNLGTKLYNRILKKAADPADLNMKIQEVKAACNAAFDGDCLTPPQKAELKKTLKDALARD